ncbi:MAG: DUF3850 domain-containing protein [Lachnospiraceae bacterium]|nr:DUF3850 domain-containing protein [Lachnospiraceae bacterium]
MKSQKKITIHKIKIQRQFADAVQFGYKKFEIRKNDRNYQEGDILRFTCIDDKGNQVYHPINIRQYKITYMLNGWGLKKGYVAFGIEEIKEDITMDLINQRLDEQEDE